MVVAASDEGESFFCARMGQDEDACMALGLGLEGPTGHGAHGAFVCISSLDAAVAENGGNETPQVGDVIVAFRNTRVSPGFVSTKVRPRCARTLCGCRDHVARRLLPQERERARSFRSCTA